MTHPSVCLPQCSKNGDGNVDRRYLLHQRRELLCSSLPMRFVHVPSSALEPRHTSKVRKWSSCAIVKGRPFARFSVARANSLLRYSVVSRFKPSPCMMHKLRFSKVSRQSKTSSTTGLPLTYSFFMQTTTGKGRSTKIFHTLVAPAAGRADIGRLIP